jgi:serine/threonine-protein kinase
MVLPRRAVIKVVHAAFAQVKPFVVQTLREACILEAIAHPGVPVVYESGVLRDRRPWFAFELISGSTLDELFASRALTANAFTPAEVAGMMRDLVDIIEQAHRRGVIHRGLRPDRVVVTPGRRYPLCIPDWSEAIAHDATEQVAPSTPEASRSYLAPELAQQFAQGTREHVDDRVDMFALGVIAYRALTGRLPFDAIRQAFPQVPTAELRPDAPPELAALIDSLLAFDRFDRPSASEVRADIDWLVGTLPELQRRAASRTFPPAGAPAKGNYALQPRLRRPRWTPEVHYLESTDVDIEPVDDDREEAGTT